MAITDYDELQEALATWMDDSTLTGNGTDFITLAESYFNRKLRVRQMMATDLLTTSSGAAALPDDFLQVISVRFSGDSGVRDLDPVDDTVFGSVLPVAGVPCRYTVFGSSLYTSPFDDTADAIHLSYYQKIPVLSDSNDTNWLLTAHPDLYLFGSLAEAELMTKDGESGAVWKSRRDEVLDEIHKSSNLYYRATPAIRPIGRTP